MTDVLPIADDADAKATVEALDALYALPTPGVHIGGGIHVAIDPLVPGPGWTLHQALPLKDSATGEIAIPLAEELGALSALLADPDATKAIPQKDADALADKLTKTTNDPKWDGSATVQPYDPTAK